MDLETLWGEARVLRDLRDSFSMALRETRSLIDAKKRTVYDRMSEDIEILSLLVEGLIETNNKNQYDTED